MPAVLGATESLPLPRGLKGDAPGTTAGRCWAGQDQGEARTEGTPGQRDTGAGLMLTSGAAPAVRIGSGPAPAWPGSLRGSR